MSDFHGETTGELENEFLRLEYLLNSPRIVRLLPKGKSNLFADLGRESLSTPYGEFFFRGGHRLWHAPEEYPRTYIPDNDADIEQIPSGVCIRQPPEPLTHIAKTIEIILDPGEPLVSIKHEFRNEGSSTVELASWALSMMRLGGIAIIPQPPRDENGKSPNRNLVLWPYSEISDPRLELGDDFMLVRGEPRLPALKIGCLCNQGWIGYWLEGIFFVKRFAAPDTDRHYPDRECNTEVYCNDKFIELETLGPLIQLEAGDSVTHVETWEIYDTLKVDGIPEELQQLLVGN